MKIQLVMEWSDDGDIVGHTATIGKPHEVYGNVGLWLEVMNIDTGLTFFYTDDEWKTNWKKEIFSYSRQRAIIVDKSNE